MTLSENNRLLRDTITHVRGQESLEDTNLYWSLKDAIVRAFVFGTGDPGDHYILRDAFMDVQNNGYFTKYR